MTQEVITLWLTAGPYSHGLCGRVSAVELGSSKKLQSIDSCSSTAPDQSVNRKWPNISGTVMADCSLPCAIITSSWRSLTVSAQDADRIVGLITFVASNPCQSTGMCKVELSMCWRIPSHIKWSNYESSQLQHTFAEPYQILYRLPYV